MATQSFLAPHSTHTFSSDPSSEGAISTEQRTIDDFESTEQRPAQPSSIDLPGYEGLVWRNVTRQRFRIPENDRPRLDSWVWKQKHGWRVWDSVGEEYWLCKICHCRRSPNKHWFKSFKSTTRVDDHMKAEHRISADGDIRSRQRATRSGNSNNTLRVTMPLLLWRTRLLQGSTCLNSEHYSCSGS